MKQILLAAVLIITGMSALQAQQTNSIVISAGNTKHIKLGDNLNVVLISAPNDKPGDVSLSSESFAKLGVRLAESTIHLSRESNLKPGETVYVLVNGLETLSLGENTSVATHGILNSKKIDVYVTYGSAARIMTTGKVNAYSLDETEVSIKKLPYPKQPAASAFVF